MKDKKEFKIKIKKGQSLEKIYNNKMVCDLCDDNNCFVKDLEIIIRKNKN